MRTAKKITQSARRGKIAKGKKALSLPGRVSVGVLTRDQKSLIKEFMARDEDVKDVERFNEAFDAIIKLEKLKITHKEASSKAYRSRLRKRIRFYENKIAPAPKQAAIERNDDLSRFLFQYLRRYGFPKNTSHLLRRMEEKGLLDVENTEGKVRTLNHRTVRLMIEDMRRPFSWPKPGRRRAMTRRKSVAQHRHELKRVQPSLPKLKFLEPLLKSAEEARNPPRIFPRKTAT
jgi:hypothetical protein